MFLSGMASPHEALPRLQQYASSLLKDPSDNEPVNLEEESAYADRLDRSLQSLQHQFHERENVLERVRGLGYSWSSLSG